jgi:ketosteroid isomerase-like protein
MPKQIAIGLALAVALLLNGCSTMDPKPSSSAGEHELMEVDRAFSRLSQEKGEAVAFVAFAAPDATMLPMNLMPVQGRDAIRELMSGGPASVLTWEPKAAGIAASGDLGYTWGFYEARRADGAGPVKKGKYITVWRKQPDGSWKFVVDGGNSNPES